MVDAIMENGARPRLWVDQESALRKRWVDDITCGFENAGRGRSVEAREVRIELSWRVVG